MLVVTQVAAVTRRAVRTIPGVRTTRLEEAAVRRAAAAVRALAATTAKARLSVQRVETSWRQRS